VAAYVRTFTRNQCRVPPGLPASSYCAVVDLACGALAVLAGATDKRRSLRPHLGTTPFAAVYHSSEWHFVTPRGMSREFTRHAMNRNMVLRFMATLRKSGVAFLMC
jgi:hypothetical protein